VEGLSEHQQMKSDAPDPSILDQLPAIEAVAVDLPLAGPQIIGRLWDYFFTVRCETGLDDAAGLRDPVSERSRC
jgi:hypothetical protein